MVESQSRNFCLARLGSPWVLSPAQDERKKCTHRDTHGVVVPSFLRSEEGQCLGRGQYNCRGVAGPDAKGQGPHSSTSSQVEGILWGGSQSPPGGGSPHPFPGGFQASVLRKKVRENPRRTDSGLSHSGLEPASCPRQDAECVSVPGSPCKAPQTGGA